jgi:hypothetical protein
LEDEDGAEDDNDDNLNAGITVPVQLSKKEKVSARKKKRDDALISEV